MRDAWAQVREAGRRGVTSADGESAATPLDSRNPSRAFRPPPRLLPYGGVGTPAYRPVPSYPFSMSDGSRGVGWLEGIALQI